jgi:adenosylcobyric acid synthase
VVLVADIDRGGVFATLVGTLSLLEPQDRALVGALVINKFRGDKTILDPGLTFLEEHTGVPVAGVIPYVGDLGIAEEDSLGLERAVVPLPTNTVLDIAVVRLPHISNFDDFDPLRREPSVLLRYVSAVPELGEPDLIILPGTKTTMADLDWLRERGLDRAVIDAHARGTPVVGVCGGYQMLGKLIIDPDHVESDHGRAQGLGLLPVTTVFSDTKTTHRVNAMVATGSHGLLQECGGQRVEGYEIHMGRTTGTGVASPFRIVERSGQAVDQPDGAMDEQERVLGTYMHGLFSNDGFRRGVLRSLARWKGITLPEATGDDGSGLGYDGLAALVREHLDMSLIYRLAGLEQGTGSGP